MSTFNKSHNRFASVAGQFYPSGQPELNAELQRLFANAIQQQHTNVIALIAPNSGYMFSGKIAASAYNQIDPQRRFKRVFILASSHLDSFMGASVFCDGDYVVPTGIAEVDQDFGHRLVMEHPNLFTDARTPHFHEHSIEVQLPFLIHHLKQPFKVVPIVLGTHTPAICKKLADVLKPELNDDNLFVISTDFSCLLPSSTARRVDEETEQAILSNKPDKLMRTLEKHEKRNLPGFHTSLYSWSAMLTLLYMTSGNHGMVYQPIDQCNSGDIPYYGNYEKVTGYRALALTHDPGAQHAAPESDQSLLSKTKSAFGKLFGNK